MSNFGQVGFAWSVTIQRSATLYLRAIATPRANEAVRAWANVSNDTLGHFSGVRQARRGQAQGGLRRVREMRQMVRRGTMPHLAR